MKRYHDLVLGQPNEIKYKRMFGLGPGPFESDVKAKDETHPGKEVLVQAWPPLIPGLLVGNRLQPSPGLSR